MARSVKVISAVILWVALLSGSVQAQSCVQLCDADFWQTATREQLGPVEIHRVRIIVAPMWIMASKLVSVLQARIAIRLNSLSF